MSRLRREEADADTDIRSFRSQFGEELTRHVFSHDEIMTNLRLEELASGPQAHESLVDASCEIAESLEYAATSNVTENLFELYHVKCSLDLHRDTCNMIRRRPKIS